MTNLTTYQSKDINLCRQILTTNVGLKPNESFLVVTDSAMKPIEGSLWLDAGKLCTPNHSMVVLTDMTQNAQEPPSPIANLMAKTSVAILQTTYSLSHTQARRTASQQGTRIISLPNADLDMIRRTLDLDYDQMKRRCDQLATSLTGKSQVILTNPAGTDLRLSILNKRPQTDTGIFLRPGDFGNLPAGETMLAPIEGSTDGVIIIEGSFAAIPTDTPIKVTVKHGQAIEIEGGLAANYLNNQIRKLGRKARNIAELGIGANPKVNPRGKALEAEKAYGTVHIALGNNVSYGGTINVPFHSDGIILSPTLIIDGKMIIDNGEFTI